MHCVSTSSVWFTRLEYGPPVWSLSHNCHHLASGAGLEKERQHGFPSGSHYQRRPEHAVSSYTVDASLPEGVSHHASVQEVTWNVQIYVRVIVNCNDCEIKHLPWRMGCVLVSNDQSIDFAVQFVLITFRFSILTLTLILMHFWCNETEFWL